MQPVAQTNSLALVWIHSFSAISALSLTATLSGFGLVGVADNNGSDDDSQVEREEEEEEEEEEGYNDLRMGSSTRRVKLIWHSTLKITDRWPVK